MEDLQNCFSKKDIVLNELIEHDNFYSSMNVSPRYINNYITFFGTKKALNDIKHTFFGK